jgi:hypothetical protein
MHDDPQPGETFRLVQRVEREHGAILAEIREDLKEVRAQTTLTNGTVGRHEERVRVLEREMSDLKQTRAHVAQALTGSSGDDKRSMTLSVPMDTKTVLIVLGALATVLLLIAKGLQES